MDVTFGDSDLEGFLIKTKGSKKNKNQEMPGLVVCRGFPRPEQEYLEKGYSYRPLGEHVSKNLGWRVLLFNYRGLGKSPGNFSMNGWLADVSQAIDYMATQASEVWVTGFGVGGALAICAGAEKEIVAGVATVGAPADFSAWENNADGLLAHAKESGLISAPDFPSDFEAWKAELNSLEVEKHSRKMGSEMDSKMDSKMGEKTSEKKQKPLLVIHSSDDAMVPSLEARAIADNHGSADIRIMESINHRLVVDPRVSAIISGWLYRNAVS